MQRIVSRALRLLACLALTLALSSAAQAGPDGTWTWTTPAQGDRPERTTTLKLKTEGDKLTGTISGRQNQEDIKISEAKLAGDEVTFKVVRERNGNTFTQKYAGKLAGDTIKGKITFERGGEERTIDWEAKRKAEEKK